METVENGGPIDVPIYVPNKRRARVRGLSDFNIPQKRKSSLPGLDWRRHSYASIAPTSPFMKSLGRGRSQRSNTLSTHDDFED